MRRLIPVLSLALSVPALGQAVGSEFQVNSYTTQDQYQYGPSAVAADGVGNFVVVWQGRGATGLEIRGQRFAANGSPLGGEFTVNTYTSGLQYRASVAANASGEFVVVWQDRGQVGVTPSDSQDGSDSGVFGQAFSSSGVPVGGEFRVSETTLGYQTRPKVTAAGDGTFVTSWLSVNGPSPDVFVRRFDASGTPVGGEFVVNSYTTGVQYTPAVAGDGSGGFVVAWSGSGAGDTNYPGGGVFARRFNNADVPLSGDFRVNTHTTGTQYVPSVGVAANGDFVVVWGSGTPTEPNGQDGSEGGIFGQRFDNVGEPLGGEFQVNSFTSGYQLRPALGVAANGTFVVSWFSEGQDGSDTGVFGQVYEADGTPRDGEFQVNTHTPGYQRFPSIGMAPNGRYAVAWNSYFQDGDVFGVFGQRYTLGDSTPPMVEVAIPNGGETWAAGTTQSVVWTATDDTELDHFEAFLSRDAGATFTPTPICTSPQPDQFCDWVVSGPASTTARVKVVAYDTSGNSAEDVSDANFTITSPFVTVTAPDTAGIAWKAGTTKAIKFIHSLGKNKPVLIELNRDYPGGAWEVIANPALTTKATNSTYNWLVTAPATNGATARIRITALEVAGVTDTNNASFAIESRVKVTQPNTAVAWKVATTKVIKWNHNYPVPHSFRIDIDRDGDLACEEPIAASVVASGGTGTYSWVVTAPAGGNNRICVSSLSDPLGTDHGDVAFTINP